MRHGSHNVLNGIRWGVTISGDNTERKSRGYFSCTSSTYKRFTHIKSTQLWNPDMSKWLHNTSTNPTTTPTTPCQHALLLLACQKLLHRTWRVLSFTIATIFIHLHQMSCTAPSSAKDLVVFDDESLSSFCFSYPTPHEAGKGPVERVWHNHTSKWDSILLYNQFTQFILFADRLDYSVTWKMTVSAESWAKEKKGAKWFCSVFSSHHKPFEWCFPHFHRLKLNKILILYFPLTKCLKVFILYQK